MGKICYSLGMSMEKAIFILFTISASIILLTFALGTIKDIFRK